MKKYFLKSVVIITLFFGLLTACSTDEVIYEGSPAVSGFASTISNLPVFEGSDGIGYVAVNVSNTSSENRTIKYTIDQEKSTADPSQYTILEAIVPANSYNGYIKVQTSYDKVTRDPVTVYFILESVGDVAVQPELDFNTLSISQSCEIDYDLIANSEYIGLPTANGFDYLGFLPKLTQNPNKPNEFIFDTFWGTDFVFNYYGDSFTSLSGLYPYAGRLVINQDLTVTIYGFETYATGGSGTYDPCTNTFNYTLTNELKVGFGDEALETLYQTPVVVTLFGN
ncbi:MAG TPA: hypothetical protein VN192_04565 [Flavobacterium sp.]|nr:hypothetical protein [Flavobacterium sp.]